MIMGLNKKQKQGQVTVVKTPRRLWGAALVLLSLWLFGCRALGPGAGRAA